MIGVSIQPHIKYGHNAVLDFYYWPFLASFEDENCYLKLI
jgi:hypothetical protein